MITDNYTLLDTKPRNNVRTLLLSVLFVAIGLVGTFHVTKSLRSNSIEAEVGAAGESSQTTAEGAELVKMGNGMDKQFWCCSSKAGEDWGYLKTTQAVIDRELGAMTQLSAIGALAPVLLQFHKTSEGGDWGSPQGLGDGYWIQKVTIVADFKPKMHKIEALAGLKKKLKPIKALDAAKVKAISGLSLVNDNIDAICGIVGELTILIAGDGTVKLSDVAPGQDGTVANQELDSIKTGLGNVIASLSA